MTMAGRVTRPVGPGKPRMFSITCWIIVALSAALVGLKLSGAIHWSWVAVLLPVIAGFALLLVMLAVLVGVAVGFGAAAAGDRS